VKLFYNEILLRIVVEVALFMRVK